MKRQKMQMLLLGIVLIICAAGYAAADRITSSKEAAEQKKEEGEYAALSFDQSMLTQLQIASENGTLALSYDGESWEFIDDIDAEMAAEGSNSETDAEDSTAVEDSAAEDSAEDSAEEDGAKEASAKTYEVNSSKADEILEALANLTCTNEMTDVTDMEQYGLDAPKATVSVTLSDGTPHTVEIGVENTMISCHYLRVDGGDTVYTVSNDTYELLCQTDTEVAQEAAE